MEVRAVEVTSSNIGDAPMLPELLNQIPPDQDIGTVTADGPMTRVNATRQLPPEVPTLIPPRKNAKP
ncbi:transposase [Sulfitobacter sp.]|uniref:transposase n=1 Tax=Sulfitobacter sp. TaxID=1903071 RepID=UPI003FCDF40E